VSAPIESYALIGNCYTAALVGLDGSIDWLCLPNFGSGAVFAAILGNPEHGRWLICPAGPYTVKRKYRGDTMILETEFTTETGVVTLIDFMPRPGSADCSRNVELVRIVRGDKGTVPMRLEAALRFDYGHVVPWVQRVDHSIRAVAGPDAILFHSPIETHGEHFRTVADFTVAEGQSVPLAMIYYPSHTESPVPRDALYLLMETEKFWTAWSAKYTAKHKYRDAVMRSLLTLKAMTYEPTGGIVAAPTTSLPEEIGGVRNWDYRYCWIRDATLTLYALISCGYLEEAGAWRQWLIRAAAGKPSELQIMYGLHGERRLTEFELDWLPGYDSCKPVRVGNGASEQFQLDVYGELMGALHLARKAGLTTDFEGWALQINLMHFIEHAWNRPDSGIWEVRGPRRHFTHSKVMAWMAVDRSIQDAEEFKLQAPLEKWKALRDEMHTDICEKGFNKELNSFTQYYGGTELDASLLIISHTGFLPPDDPRLVGTVEAIEKDLMEDGFVLRYKTESNVDGLPAGEAAFLPCSFWLADSFVQIGRRKDAAAFFDRLLALRNDVGLIAEMYDAKLGRQLGNFPQAFTHIALIATAALLAGEQGAKDPMSHGPATAASGFGV
jgi:GH15 family glucan-1,4-alpha-glucosidase